MLTGKLKDKRVLPIGIGYSDGTIYGLSHQPNRKKSMSLENVSQSSCIYLSVILLVQLLQKGVLKLLIESSLLQKPPQNKHALTVNDWVTTLLMNHCTRKNDETCSLCEQKNNLKGC
uniref:Uncharacterized protein n=1 Tax=Lactuca sativa TaxID=4236 RepID=A0A9R1VQN4_LACSA|nr:hypothetical protein LSAT_V11C400219900 [Lactuca sativa]